MIFQRPATDDIMRDFFQELRRERGERIGKFPVREPEPFQGHGHPRQVHRRLSPRDFLRVVIQEAFDPRARVFRPKLAAKKPKAA